MYLFICIHIPQYSHSSVSPLVMAHYPFSALSATRGQNQFHAKINNWLETSHLTQHIPSRRSWWSILLKTNFSGSWRVPQEQENCIHAHPYTHRSQSLRAGVCYTLLSRNRQKFPFWNAPQIARCVTWRVGREWISWDENRSGEEFWQQSRYPQQAKNKRLIIEPSDPHLFTFSRQVLKETYFRNPS